MRRDYTTAHPMLPASPSLECPPLERAVTLPPPAIDAEGRDCILVWASGNPLTVYDHLGAELGIVEESNPVTFRVVEHEGEDGEAFYEWHVVAPRTNAENGGAPE